MNKYFLNFYIFFKILLLTVFLSNCATVDQQEVEGDLKNYKCVAKNVQENNIQTIGWATTRKRAIDNALEKCQHQSIEPSGCRLDHCITDNQTDNQNDI